MGYQFTNGKCSRCGELVPNCQRSKHWRKHVRGMNVEYKVKKISLGKFPRFPSMLLNQS